MTEHTGVTEEFVDIDIGDRRIISVDDSLLHELDDFNEDIQRIMTEHTGVTEEFADIDIGDRRRISVDDSLLHELTISTMISSRRHARWMTY